MAGERLLEVRELAVSYGTRQGRIQAVRGVSFDLLQGETLALVGQSGCGKSATAKALMGLLPQNGTVDGGTARLAAGDHTPAGVDLPAGHDLLDHPPWGGVRGSGLAMVFQDPMSALNPLATVGRQIAEVFRRGRSMPRPEARARAIELMAAVGIPDAPRRYGQYPFQYSGGMAQRVCIAIALAGDPQVLICDEPTSALDVTIQAQVLALIGEIQRQRGLAILFITHDLGVVAHMAHRVAVMYAGRIVEIGLAEEVFYDPRHPYTWSLLAGAPGPEGRPPGVLGPAPGDASAPGDAFAPFNPHALAIDYAQHPPMFRVSDTHYAATWLLHPDAPRVAPPQGLPRRGRAEP